MEYIKESIAILSPPGELQHEQSRLMASRSPMSYANPLLSGLHSKNNSNHKQRLGYKSQQKDRTYEIERRNHFGYEARISMDHAEPSIEMMNAAVVVID